MAGKDRGTELPHRVRGTAWTGPLSPAASVLSPGLRQCMQAAVTAERAGAVVRDQQRAAGNRTAEPPHRPPPSGSAASQEAAPDTSSPGNGTSGERTGAAPAGAAARPERIPGAAPEVEGTAWLGFAARPRPAAGLEPVAGARATAEPGPAVRPQPGKPRRRAVARLLVLGLALIVIGSLAAAAIKHISRRAGRPGGCPRAGCRLGRRAGQPGCHRVM
jgi:hypothetical protein